MPGCYDVAPQTPGRALWSLTRKATSSAGSTIRISPCGQLGGGALGNQRAVREDLADAALPLLIVGFTSGLGSGGRGERRGRHEKCRPAWSRAAMGAFLSFPKFRNHLRGRQSGDVAYGVGGWEEGSWRVRLRLHTAGSGNLRSNPGRPGQFGPWDWGASEPA